MSTLALEVPRKDRYSCYREVSALPDHKTGRRPTIARIAIVLSDVTGDHSHAEKAVVTSLSRQLSREVAA